MKIRLLALGILFLSMEINAQEKQNDIDEVLIEGKFKGTLYKNVNENVTIITPREIQNSPAKSIDELLQQVAGVDVRKRGANGVQSDVSIRGGSYSQILILVNGIEINDSQTAHNSFNFPFDLENVERIEVIKGPAARRFGNNAYSGVINIITKASKEKKVRISAEGGDFETYHLGFSASGGNDKYSQSLTANTSSSEGYKHNTDYKIHNVYYQNRLNLDNGHFDFQAGFSEKKFGANGFYATLAATEQYEETQASIVSASYHQKFSAWNINSNIYWRRGQDMYLYIRNKPSVYRNMHIGNNVGFEANASYDSFFGTTGLGVKLKREFLVSNNLGKRNRTLTQLFFEHHFSFLNGNLQITPGISWAHYATEGQFFYPGIDLGYKISENNQIYANVAKVHRLPSFTDLYYVSPKEEGNVNLKPESALSSELGYRFHRHDFSAKLSGFMRNSDDSIDWSFVNQKWRADNVEKVKLKGLEVEVNHRPFDWLNYTFNYTYIDHKRIFKDGISVSKYALDNLKHQFVAKLENQFLKYFTNELVYRYNERLNTISYHLLDEKIAYSKDDFSVYLLVNNLTNTKFFETQVTMPGRWFHVGVTYDIKFY